MKRDLQSICSPLHKKNLPTQNFNRKKRRFFATPKANRKFRKENNFGLTLYQLLPKFSAPARVRDHYGAAHYVGHSEDFVNFFCGNALFVAFTQVVLDAVVAAEHHTGYQAQHFFCLYRQRAFGIRIRIQVKKPVDDFVVFAEDHLIHFGPVVVEFLHHKKVKN
jgi:hypothetical protein